MTRYIILIVAFCTACNEDSRLYDTRIISVITTQEKAWNAGDIEGFMQGYWHNDSMQFISKNGMSYGWKKTLENYKKAYPSQEKMGKLKFSNLKINKLSHDLAQVTGQWQISYPKDAIGGHFSLIFKAFENGPKIIIDHTW
jgi:hypothetical protein